MVTGDLASEFERVHWKSDVRDVNDCTSGLRSIVTHTCYKPYNCQDEADRDIIKYPDYCVISTANADSRARKTSPTSTCLFSWQAPTWTKNVLSQMN